MLIAFDSEFKLFLDKNNQLRRKLGRNHERETQSVIAQDLAGSHQNFQNESVSDLAGRKRRLRYFAIAGVNGGSGLSLRGEGEHGEHFHRACLNSTTLL